MGDGIFTQMRGTLWVCMLHSPSPTGCLSPSPHLCQRGVQLEYLAFPFHLPHADLAGELCGGQAVPLQAEGAVQGLLAATPNVIEGDLLNHRISRQDRWKGLSWQVMRSGLSIQKGRGSQSGQGPFSWKRLNVGERNTNLSV